jgi:hypothetical protein
MVHRLLALMVAISAVVTAGAVVRPGVAAATSIDGNPIGHVDVVRREPGGVRVAGWALDPDTSAPIAVHVYIDGAARAVPASGPRPDIAAAHPGYGPAHGFDAFIAAATGRVSTMCVYAVNVGRGTTNPLLGCHAVDLSGTPFGSIDLSQGRPTTMAVAGWAIDPDSAAPIAIHFYVDGVFRAAATADRSRVDVSSRFPGYGATHGFQIEVPSQRTQHVCAYLVNAAGPGRNRLLGCRIDPTTGRPPPAGATAPPFSAGIRAVTGADLGNAWRPGCPVGPASLRYVSVTYWGFDGAARQGGIVLHQDWAGAMVGVFGRLYGARVQLQRLEPVTWWSGPGDDSADRMNISSSFMCRPAVGSSGWSEHAYGRAIDINPIQNPYVRSGTVIPDPEGRDYLDRSQRAPAMVHTGDPVVQAFASIGWTWGGNWRTLKDYMHFSSSGR